MKKNTSYVIPTLFFCYLYAPVGFLKNYRLHVQDCRDISLIHSLQIFDSLRESSSDDKIRLRSAIDRLVSLVFRIHRRLMRNYMHRMLNREGRAYWGCIHDDKKCEREEGARKRGGGGRSKKDGQSLARYKFRHLPQ